jgi:hypothetical protein
MLTILQEIDAREREYIAEIEYLREDVKHWKDLYMKSVHDSIKHNEAMSAQILVAALNGAFTPKGEPEK